MEYYIRAFVDKSDKLFTKLELNSWFKNNSDDKGNVTKDIILYEDSYCENKEEFVMSDFGLNRLGMKIDPKGWLLKNYKKNPVILWNHDDRRPSIGKMSNVRVENNKLLGKAEFDSTDPFAVSIEQKLAAGYLTSGSVGFKTIKVEMKESKDQEPILISREQELFEWSIVNIPALTSAIIKNKTQVDDPQEDYMEKLFEDKEEFSVFDDIEDFGDIFKEV